MRKSLSVILAIALILSILPLNFLVTGADAAEVVNSAAPTDIFISADKNYLETDINSELYFEDISLLFDNEWISGSDVKWSTIDKANIIINSSKISFLKAGTFSLTASYDNSSLDVTVYIIDFSDFIVNFNVLDAYVGEGGNIRIPESLNIIEIAGGVFADNTSITSVVIPEGVEVIGESAFSNCINLVSVNLPESLKKLANGGNFEGCSSLKEITLPSNLKVIPVWAFAGCSSLEKLTVSYGVEEFHLQCFYNTKLTEVVFPETVKLICGIAFHRNSISENGIKITIANPDCVVGVYTSSSGAYKNNMQHNWEKNGNSYKLAPIFYNGSTNIKETFTYITPASSNVNLQLQQCVVDSAGYNDDTNQYTTQNESYFLNLRTAQKSEEFVIENNKLITYKGNGRVIIPSTVTEIGEKAFYGNSGITSVEIPDSVTKIGQRAFAMCDKLETAVINGKVDIGAYAFEGCMSLVNASLGNLSSVGENVFSECHSLKNMSLSGSNSSFSIDNGVLYNGNTLVRFPAGVEDTTYTINENITEIFAGAFEGCVNLKTVNQKFTYDKNATELNKIGNSAFKGCINLNDTEYSASGGIFNLQTRTKSMFESITSLGEVAFADCRALPFDDNDKLVKCSESAVSNSGSIGKDTFLNTKMPSFVLSEKVTTVGAGAFQGCAELTAFTASSNTSTVDDSAFAGCKNLSTITLGGIKSVGSNAFAGCSKLTALDISKFEAIGERAFANCSALISATINDNINVLSKDLFYGCSSLNNISAKNVLSIENGAFAYCFSFVGNDNLFSKVSHIGKDAFICCNSLTSVSLTSELTDIDADAFMNCGALASITIPKKAVSIAEGAFYNTAYFNNNANWENGCLYIGNHLLTVTSDVGETLNVKAGTITLADGAARNSNNISKLILPYGLEKIGNFVFAECTSLTDITVPNTVVSVQPNSFIGCGKFNENLNVSITKADDKSECELIFDSASDLKYINYFGYRKDFLEDKANIKISCLDEVLNETSVICFDDIGFSVAALTVTNGIAINFKVSQDIFNSYGFAEPYAEFKMGEDIVKVSDYTITTDEASNTTYYSFDFTDIAPHKMGDTVEATLFAKYKDNIIKCKSIEYSIKQYCYSVLNSNSSDKYLKTAIVDMLYYGAESQKYMNYKVNELVTNDLTDALNFYRTTTLPKLESQLSINSDNENPTVNWLSIGLNLKDSVNIRFKISTKEDINDIKLVVKSEKGNVYEVGAEGFIKTGNDYYVMFGALTAAQMREKIEVAFYKGEEQISKTLFYSIESYAARNINNPALTDILYATIKYGDAIYNYYHELNKDNDIEDNWDIDEWY